MSCLWLVDIIHEGPLWYNYKTTMSDGKVRERRGDEGCGMKCHELFVICWHRMQGVAVVQGIHVWCKDTGKTYTCLLCGMKCRFLTHSSTWFEQFLGLEISYPLWAFLLFLRVLKLFMRLRDVHIRAFEPPTRGCLVLKDLSASAALGVVSCNSFSCIGSVAGLLVDVFHTQIRSSVSNPMHPREREGGKCIREGGREGGWERERERGGEGGREGGGEREREREKKKLLSRFELFCWCWCHRWSLCFTMRSACVIAYKYLWLVHAEMQRPVMEAGLGYPEGSCSLPDQGPQGGK